MAVSDQIYDAIKLVTDYSIERANYDKTIKAKIVNCEDWSKGKYKCSYNDIYITAYSAPTITYNEGAEVYILVPQNDFEKQKTILRSVNNIGANYIAPFIKRQIDIQQMITEQPQAIYLCSEMEGTITSFSWTGRCYKRKIYGWSDTIPNQIPDPNNDIKIWKDIPLTDAYKSANAETIRKKKKGGIQISARFNTFFPSNVIKGHYGIEVFVKFSTGPLRQYFFKDTDFKKNPLKMKNDFQSISIDIDDLQNFLRIESVCIYDYGFQDNGDPDNPIEQSPEEIIDNISTTTTKVNADMADIAISELQISFYSYNTTKIENPTKFFREDGIWAVPAGGSSSTTVDITEVTDEPSNIDLKYDKVYKLTVNGVSKNFKTPAAPVPVQNVPGGEILFALSGTTNFEVGRRIYEN